MSALIQHPILYFLVCLMAAYVAVHTVYYAAFLLMFFINVCIRGWPQGTLDRGQTHIVGPWGERR
jgi:hypothetical protein